MSLSGVEDKNIEKIYGWSCVRKLYSDENCTVITINDRVMFFTRKSPEERFQQTCLISYNPSKSSAAVISHLAYYAHFKKNYHSSYVRLSTTSVIKQRSPEYSNIPDEVFVEIDEFLDSTELYKKMGGYSGDEI